MKREELICRLRQLLESDAIKQSQYQEETGSVQKLVALQERLYR